MSKGGQRRNVDPTGYYDATPNSQGRHLSGSAFCWDKVCISRQWEGWDLGLGLVVEHKPTKFSFIPQGK